MEKHNFRILAFKTELKYYRYYWMRKCTKIADENGKVYENLDAANFLNDYYVNVGPNLAKKHKKEWKKENCKINVETEL